jgi:hypothetical protein
MIKNCLYTAIAGLGMLCGYGHAGTISLTVMALAPAVVSTI